MSRRIEIELTSKREDGSWTWRAAGAQQPKGVVEGSVVPDGAQVKDIVRAEVEADLDGTRVLSIAPVKQKAARTGLLEFIPSDKPFEPVTQQLRKKGGRDGDKRRGPRRDGDKPRGERGERREGGERRERREGGDRPRRQFFEAPPELPQRPKPKRIKPRRVNVDAVLAELPEAQRAIAEKVLNGGVPAVRAAIEEQNKAAVAEGREKVPAEGLIQIAENLLPRLRVAEWKDKAASAEQIIEDIDLRDLRSIVVTAEQLVAIDEATRAQVAKMKQALVVRQETEIRNWLDDIAAATKVGRVVRALRLSSQPPKAGVPFPPALATALIDAAVLSLTADAPAERWITVLEAAAFSPVHAKVLPPAVPPAPSEELLKTITRLGPLMPQLAALFGIMVDPKARPPRPLQQPRGDKAAARKPARAINKSADATEKPAGRPASKKAETRTADAREQATPADAPVESAPVESAPAVEATVDAVVETRVEAVGEAPAADAAAGTTPVE